MYNIFKVVRSLAVKCFRKECKEQCEWVELLGAHDRDGMVRLRFFAPPPDCRGCKEGASGPWCEGCPNDG